MDIETRFRELVGLIYDAAIEPSRWPVFLEKFADAVETTSTVIVLYDLERRNGDLAAAVRFDPEYQRMYNEYYSGLDCYAAHGSHLITTGNVVPGQLLCADRVLEHSEFHSDFLSRIDIFHELCGCIFQEQSIVSVLSTLRPKRAGPLGEEQVRLLQMLMPHLQRAMQVHQRIGTLETKAESALELLDHMPTGCIMVGADGKVFMLNRRARSIIDQNDGLAISRDRLCARLTRETSRLQELIHKAAAAGSGKDVHPGGVMLLSRPSLRRSLHVVVAPVRPRETWLVSERPAAVVFVCDPDSRPESDERIMARLYGLTPAEARLASILVQGVSLELAAEKLGVTRHTVHSQLRRIFEKTETHRQAELVRVLLSGLVDLNSH